MQGKQRQFVGAGWHRILASIPTAEEKSRMNEYYHSFLPSSLLARYSIFNPHLECRRLVEGQT
jgi:hypothetical protein